MGANNNSLPTDNTGQRNDDAGLRPGNVAHKAGTRQGVAALGNGLLDALKQPLGGGDTVGRVEVAVVEAGVLSKLLLDPVGVDPLNDLLDSALVVSSVGERQGSEQPGGGGLDTLELGDVEEVLPFLQDFIPFSNQVEVYRARTT
jgi:hypothetical protein